MAILIPRKKDYWQKQLTAFDSVNWGHELLDGGGAVWLFHNKDAPENLSYSDSVYEYQLDNSAGAPTPSALGVEFGSGSDYVSATINESWDTTSTFGLVSSGPVPLSFNLLSAAATGFPDRYIKIGTNGYDVRNGGSRALYVGGVAHAGGEPLNLSLVLGGPSSQTMYRQGALVTSTTNSVSNISCNRFAINAILDSTPAPGTSWTCAMAYYLRSPLNAGEIAELHFNPSQILKSRRKYWVLPTAAAPTGFQAAWAMSSRRAGLIGAR